MGLLEHFFVGTDEVKFVSQVLSEYREVRKVYAYQYEQQDLQALQACAKDLRPFTWSLLPSFGTWFASGKLIATKGRPVGWRVMVMLARVMGTGQVFRLGYLAGSYRQTTGCMTSMVALPTPLGGEICALIRAKDPRHPYLKYERAPAGYEINPTGRPRIANEQNRLAQIAKFRKELANAKAGKTTEQEKGEVMEGLIEQQAETLDGIVNAAQQYEARRRERAAAEAAAAGVSSSAEVHVSSGPHGLVITEAPSEGPASQAAQEAAGGSGSSSTGPAGELGAGAGAGGDVFGGLLGGGASGWGEESEEEERKRREEERLQSRRERRRDRWGRLRRRQPETDAGQKASADMQLEGGD